MKVTGYIPHIVLAGALLFPYTAEPQAGVQSLVVSGGSGSAPVKQISGRNYVNVEDLARAANGSLTFNGGQVTLTLGSTASSTTTTPAQQDKFSSGFARAGIEALSSMREWHTALASAIENGYPVTQQLMDRYQGQAATALRLAQAAVVTEDDQQGIQLIDGEYQKMKQLSDKYISMRANMNYVAPDALQNDPSNQSLVACGKALGGMTASGEFAQQATCQ